jgi:hypothetical protein
MANEISNSLSVAVTKDTIAESLSYPSNETMAGTAFVKETQLVPTSATALNLGTITAPLGRYIIANEDSTNFVSLLSSVAGTTFNTIQAKSAISGFFSSNVTAPAVNANTASCRIKYLILPL